jgi:hypothetical protein
LLILLFLILKRTPRLFYHTVITRMHTEWI